MNFLEERTIRGGKKGQNNAQKNRINEEITAKEVRLIDAEGEQAGIVSTRDAQNMAEEAGLDLVEISPNAEPPVCKVMDYGKFLLKKQKSKKNKRKSKSKFRLRKLNSVLVLMLVITKLSYVAFASFLRVVTKLKSQFASVVVKWRTKKLVSTC